MRIKETDNVGRHFRSANGEHIPNQGETTISGRDSGGNMLKVVTIGTIKGKMSF